MEVMRQSSIQAESTHLWTEKPLLDPCSLVWHSRKDSARSQQTAKHLSARHTPEDPHSSESPLTAVRLECCSELLLAGQRRRLECCLELLLVEEEHLEVEGAVLIAVCPILAVAAVVVAPCLNEKAPEGCHEILRSVPPLRHCLRI